MPGPHDVRSRQIGELLKPESTVPEDTDDQLVALGHRATVFDRRALLDSTGVYSRRVRGRRVPVRRVPLRGRKAMIGSSRRGSVDDSAHLVFGPGADLGLGHLVRADRLARHDRLVQAKHLIQRAGEQLTTGRAEVGEPLG